MNAPKPVDYRIYNKKQDGLTKNDHFRAMVEQAYERGFRPASVCFDSWYAGLKNVKRVSRLFGRWLTAWSIPTGVAISLWPQFRSQRRGQPFI